MNEINQNNQINQDTLDKLNLLSSSYTESDLKSYFERVFRNGLNKHIYSLDNIPFKAWIEIDRWILYHSDVLLDLPPEYGKHDRAIYYYQITKLHLEKLISLLESRYPEMFI